MADDGGRRAKRRCARSKYIPGSMPSAIHYVGYVEDDETPEMIMAKFVELERIKAAAQQAKAAACTAATDASPAIWPCPYAEAEADGAAAAAAGSSGEASTDTNYGDQQDEQQQQRQQQQEGLHAWGQPQPSCQHSVPPPSEPGPAAADESGLTEEQLLEVFKQTSMFNVRTALQDNQMLVGIDEILDANGDRYADDEPVSDDDDMLRAFWSDEDDVLLSEGEEGDAERRSRRRAALRRTASGPGRGPGQPRAAALIRARHNIITAFNPITQALVRRKVRVAADRDDICHIRIPPPPLPVAWGRVVRPYMPLDRRGELPMAVPVPPALLRAMEEAGRSMDIAAMERSVYREESSLPGTDWGALLPPGGFQAAMINAGWAAEGRGDAAVQRLARLPMRRLVPKGFVFVWVHKHHIQPLCRQMRAWGYCYIENLTWVYLQPNSQILELRAPYANCSHLTLYMFRREGDGKDIELRHQRNPDVTFDCLAGTEGGAHAVPEEAFVAIETLLPTGKGRFLELWAPRGVRRPGWTHVVEAPVAAAVSAAVIPPAPAAANPAASAAATAQAGQGHEDLQGLQLPLG